MSEDYEITDGKAGCALWFVAVLLIFGLLGTYFILFHLMN